MKASIWDLVPLWKSRSQIEGFNLGSGASNLGSGFNLGSGASNLGSARPRSQIEAFNLGSGSCRSQIEAFNLGSGSCRSQIEAFNLGSGSCRSQIEAFNLGSVAFGLGSGGHSIWVLGPPIWDLDLRFGICGCCWLVPEDTSVLLSLLACA